MKIIYEPKGKAREYAPLACNLYKWCPHSCRYCYGPTLPNPDKKGLTMEEWRREWHERTLAKEDAIQKLIADTCTMRSRHDDRPVMLCFACDPYPPDEPLHEDAHGWVEMPMTRAALSVMCDQGITPIILTKGGDRACRDFDILKAAGGWFGQTMSGSGMKTWEPNAASYVSRWCALSVAMDAGLKTWISVEPVVHTGNAIEFLDVAVDARFNKIGHFKLGKLSGYDKETKAIEKSIDWPAYREQVREILNAAGYQEIFEPGVFEVGTYYIKFELREAK